MINPDAPPAFMIDGAGTLDRDDAIRLECASDVSRTLTVHVADLTDALAADPCLVETALRRGASRYRRHEAVSTMLPREVEAACTLAEGEVRPVITVRLPLDAHGMPGPAQVLRDKLADAVALTHEQAARAVKDHEDPHHAALSALREVAETLFRARLGATSAFYDFARGVFVDEDGALVKVKPAHIVGHLIVQECMVAANRAVAEWALAGDVPILYRNHVTASGAAPAAVHLEDLSAALQSEDPDELTLWLRRAELTGRRARYDAFPRGHHGLGIPVYCHVTSPLRRAADLLSQQAIAAHLDQSPAPFTADDVAGFCERLTVVIAQAKAEDGTAARQQAHQIARAILDHGANYQRMSTDRFFMLVKRATKEGIAAPGFLTEVGRRADAGMLELRDLYHLLLLPGGEQWAAAKQACLAQVARAPQQAVTLVAMHAATRGVEPPVYRHEEAGPAHQLVFAVVGQVAAADGSLVTGAVRLASTKKAAQAQTALSVLAQLAGVPDPSQDLAASAAAVRPAAPSAAAAAKTRPVDAMQALNHARMTRQLVDVYWTVGEGDPRGGPPMFHAQLTCRLPDGTRVESHGSGGTKKAAKAAAAAELVRVTSDRMAALDSLPGGEVRSAGTAGTSRPDGDPTGGEE